MIQKTEINIHEHAGAPSTHKIYNSDNVIIQFLVNTEQLIVHAKINLVIWIIQFATIAY